MKVSELSGPALDVSEFQQRCIDTIRKHPQSSVSTNELADRLRTSRVAVTSAMRALERKGLAGSLRWPHNDQWASLYWFLKGGAV
ncbi:MarR family transcriptional regulator [Paraburkholderia sediminicola]|uniref:MarR family transcriptional regulator n=1 Tax=Paraburkholderia sediminicola TaxID=458836 RepID=UPI0038BAD0A8